MALTGPRNTPRRSPEFREFTVAAGAVAYQGGLAVVDAAGGAKPGATALNLTTVGIFEDSASAGQKVRTRSGCFRFDNSATDAVDASCIGKTVYIVDDATVAKTNGTNTRSAAGVCFDIDAQGVWVNVG